MLLSQENVKNYSARYDDGSSQSDKVTEQRIKAVLTKRSFLTKSEFVEVGEWKSPRQRKRYLNNSEEDVQEIINASLLAKSERAKIGYLLALDGVSYPVASVILHFAFPDRYSILDFRALWSLGWEGPTNYNFEFWQKYCRRIQQLSKDLKLPIRTIDKALWQYSKENQ